MKKISPADKKNLQSMLTRVDKWLEQPINGVKAAYESGAVPSLYAALRGMCRKISPLARSMEKFLLSSQSPSKQSITSEQLTNKLLKTVSKIEQPLSRMLSKKQEEAPPGPSNKNPGS
jgi:hypothetical protein